MEGITPDPEDDWSIGQWVEITDGPFIELKGYIDSIDRKGGSVIVIVNLWGRKTPVNLKFTEIKRID